MNTNLLEIFLKSSLRINFFVRKVSELGPVNPPTPLHLVDTCTHTPKQFAVMGNCVCGFNQQSQLGSGF